MAGVLSTYMAALRTTLAASPVSLTALQENVSIDDVPASDKTFFSVCRAVSSDLGAIHGGAVLGEYTRGIVIKIAWQMKDDEEALEDVIADDCERIDDAILYGTWTSGIVLVNKGQETESRIKTVHRADLHYVIRFRRSVGTGT